MNSSARVLLVCDSPRQVTETIAIVNSLKNCSVIVIALNEDTAELLRAHGVQAKSYTSSVRLGITLGHEKIRKTFSLFSRFGFRSGMLFSEIALGISFCISAMRERAIAASILRQLEPDAILLEGDRSLGMSLLLLSENVRWTQRPVFLCTSASIDLEGTLLNRNKKPWTWSESFPKWFLRWWINSYPGNAQLLPDGRYRFFYSPAEHLYSRFLNGLPDNPWTIGSIHNTRVLVPSAVQESRLVALGTDPSKIHRIGSGELDTLFEASSRRLDQRLFLSERFKNPELPLIIIALPHLLEHQMASKDSHWAQISALKRLGETSEANVVYSLHPRMSKADYKIFLGSAVISDAPLNQILCAADGFIATYSSTVLWSQVYGIPTIISDLTRLNLTFFDEFVDVIKVFSEDALKVAFSDLVIKKNDVKMQFRFLAGSDVFDGKFGDRLESLIVGAIDNSNRS